MSTKAIVRKSLATVLAAGATLSIGFLSFAGMFLLSPTLLACMSALVFSAAYEGQVYNEGISQALRRIFDLNFTKKAMASDFIQEKIKARMAALLPLDNAFLIAYAEQKKFLAALEEIHHLNRHLKKQKSAAKKNLAKMELFFIAELKNEATNISKKQRTVRDIITDTERDDLIARIRRKKILMSLSWIFALGGGISSGFAAFSATISNVGWLAVALPVLASVPAGVFVALAAFAAIGYTLMFYQTMTDIIQLHGDGIKKYFGRRVEENESHAFYIARMLGITVVLGLGLFATVATAGTWWYATQQGALLLKCGDIASNIIRAVTVPLMTFAELVYNVSNSFSSVDKISRSDFGAYFKNAWGDVVNAWNSEKTLEFFNPFRFLEKCISNTVRQISFGLHLICMGAIADSLSNVPPDVATTLNALSEAPVDFNYLPTEVGEHLHSHDSMLLETIFFPVTLVAWSLKVLQATWDWGLAGVQVVNAFKKAFAGTAPGDYFFDHHHHRAPEEPQSFEVWENSNRKVQEILPVVVTAPPVVAIPVAAPVVSATVINLFKPALIETFKKVPMESNRERRSSAPR